MKTNWKKIIFIVGLFIVLLFLSCLNDSSLATTSSDSLKILKSEKQEFEQNEIIVKFKPGFSDIEKNNILLRVNGIVSEKIRTRSMFKAGETEGILLINTQLNVTDAINKIKGPEIEYVEPNYIYKHYEISSDPYFVNKSLWGMGGNFGSQASAAWLNGHIGSSSVVVAVIDEGVQFNHPDLSGQIWTNPYDTIDKIDNDGNGYIDDINGWDFAGKNNSIYDGGKRGTSDQHGTHVSGTIGAISNNIGVVGMNWKITIISAKFLGSNGGTTIDAIKAIDYITDLKVRHKMNIVAINNSWGGGGYSQSLYDAISRANVQDILFIVAAGNGDVNGIGVDNDNVLNYPSNYKLSNVISVAALQSNGSIATFSNFGATTVHLGAPGVNIWSTIPYNKYVSYDGTSMATPHVTGAAALYKSIHPNATASEIKSAILNNTIPTPSLKGKTISGGRLNISGF